MTSGVSAGDMNFTACTKHQRIAAANPATTVNARTVRAVAIVFFCYDVNSIIDQGLPSQYLALRQFADYRARVVEESLRHVVPVRRDVLPRH